MQNKKITKAKKKISKIVESAVRGKISKQKKENFVILLVQSVKT